MSSAPSFTTISVVAEGRRGELWLENPQKRNPLSAVCLAELAEAARWFDTQPDVTVVVVGGRGSAFCGGADLASFSGDPAADVSAREGADRGRLMADALEAMRAVAIARIQGWCVGGGVVLAAACDLRIASDSARFSIPEVDLGIPLAWGGIPRLVREIGPARTKELVMTCRPFDAAEAAQIGFVNRVVSDAELDGVVEELAASLAAKASYALSSVKQHTNAVTAAMVGMDRTWADADTLVAGLHDPEGRAAAATYLEGLHRK